MKEAISAVWLGVGLSILWGLSEWVKWQHMKNGTILARGAITGTYGNIRKHAGSHLHGLLPK